MTRGPAARPVAVTAGIVLVAVVLAEDLRKVLSAVGREAPRVRARR